MTEKKNQTNQFTYLTQEQVSELLSVHPTTLINWHKNGLLPKYQLGRRVYYKPNDIENAMIKLK